MMNRVLVLLAFPAALMGCRSQQTPEKLSHVPSVVSESCPRCQSHNVVPILQGYLGPEGWAMVERGDAVTRGCYKGGPDLHCSKCGHDFHAPPTPEQIALQARLAESAAQAVRQIEMFKRRLQERK